MPENSRAPNSEKAKPQLEWQTDDSEAAWQKFQQDEAIVTQDPPSDPATPQWSAKLWPILIALLIVAAASALWLKQHAERGLLQIESDLRQQIEVEGWTTGPIDAPLPPEFATPLAQVPLHSMMQTVELLDFAEQVAIVRLVTKPTQELPALRQTRFYRQSPTGWQRIQPQASLWGSPRRLESASFIFEYRQQDAAAVAAAAPQIEAISAEIVASFGVAPTPSKPVIQIAIDAMPGAIPFPYATGEPILVPSPAAYIAPNDLSDAAILAQSLALPLLEMTGEQAVAEYAIPPHWGRLLRGLRLWQLWQLDVPLAQWQQELVSWLYTDQPNLEGEPHPLLPQRYAELCALHRLWMLAPRVVGIPLECTPADALTWSSRQWPNLVPPLQLNALGVPQAELLNPPYRDSNLTRLSSQDVAIALFFDYIVRRYGKESLPLLQGALSQHDNWESLVPALFGQSLSDFEADWRHDSHLRLSHLTPVIN